MLGRLRPLGAMFPALEAGGCPPLRPNEPLDGSTRVRVLLPEPPPEEVLPGR